MVHSSITPPLLLFLLLLLLPLVHCQYCRYGLLQAPWPTIEGARAHYGPQALCTMRCRVLGWVGDGGVCGMAIDRRNRATPSSDWRSTQKRFLSTNLARLGVKSH
ncbi:hypothetical protein BGZ63DRAFT_374627 [Mariannaea sp. PMI_226]|nr:hypothetical protein BGZ63DRAFT_374627 [Mariannaea sp. PMI_226]